VHRAMSYSEARRILGRANGSEQGSSQTRSGGKRHGFRSEADECTGRYSAWYGGAPLKAQAKYREYVDKMTAAGLPDSVPPDIAEIALLEPEVTPTAVQRVYKWYLTGCPKRSHWCFRTDDGTGAPLELGGRELA